MEYQVQQRRPLDCSRGFGTSSCSSSQFAWPRPVSPNPVSLPLRNASVSLGDNIESTESIRRGDRVLFVWPFAYLATTKMVMTWRSAASAVKENRSASWALFVHQPQHLRNNQLVNST